MTQPVITEPVVYKKATIEILNICNAKCRWCTTGRKNSQFGIPKAEFMTAETMAEGLDYLLNNHFLEKGSQIDLYNWGEPMLNPHLKEIIHEVCKRDFKYAISSNASCSRMIPAEYLSNMSFLMFSLSGFSQQTYSKIHGLNLDTIKKNIGQMARYMKEQGCLDKLVVSFHVYQFNVCEIDAAKEFFKDLGIRVFFNFAYFADFDEFNDYLDGSMDKTALKEASDNLFLYYYDDVLQKRDMQYQCFEYTNLVLDYKLNVVPCCRLTKAAGSLFDMTPEQVLLLKYTAKECKTCHRTGQCYLVHNIPPIDSFYQFEKEKGMAGIYYDTGSGFNESEVVHFQSYLDGKDREYEIRLPKPVSRIRFDPVENKECILTNLYVKSNEMPANISVINGEVKDNIICFKTLDPQIMIDFNGCDIDLLQIKTKMNMN